MLTMLALHSFDPRLIWDAAAKNERQFPSKARNAVRFESAEGIIAGKTPYLPKRAGSRIELAQDLNGVIITADMNRNAAPGRRQSNRVVRARLGRGHLGTKHPRLWQLSGALLVAH